MTQEILKWLKKLNYINCDLDFILTKPHQSLTKIDLELISICYNLSSHISDKCREILQRANSTKES